MFMYMCYLNIINMTTVAIIANATQPIILKIISLSNCMA